MGGGWAKRGDQETAEGIQAGGVGVAQAGETGRVEMALSRKWFQSTLTSHQPSEWMKECKWTKQVYQKQTDQNRVLM